MKYKRNINREDTQDGIFEKYKDEVLRLVELVRKGFLETEIEEITNFSVPIAFLKRMAKKNKIWPSKEEFKKIAEQRAAKKTAQKEQDKLKEKPTKTPEEIAAQREKDIIVFKSIFITGIPYKRIAEEMGRSEWYLQSLKRQCISEGNWFTQEELEERERLQRERQAQIEEQRRQEKEERDAIEIARTMSELRKIQDKSLEEKEKKRQEKAKELRESKLFSKKKLTKEQKEKRKKRIKYNELTYKNRIAAAKEYNSDDSNETHEQSKFFKLLVYLFNQRLYYF